MCILFTPFVIMWDGFGSFLSVYIALHNQRWYGPHYQFDTKNKRANPNWFRVPISKRLLDH